MIFKPALCLEKTDVEEIMLFVLKHKNMENGNEKQIKNRNTENVLKRKKNTSLME